MPFCTIQAAVDAAQPGDEVLIAVGTYDEDVSITKSGTAAEPISIVGVSPDAIVDPGESQSSAFSLAGASYIDISTLHVRNGSAASVLVDGGSHVTFNKMSFGIDAWTDTSNIHITGGASDVTVAKSFFNQVYGPTVILVDGGSTGTVLTTNEIAIGNTQAVVFDDAPDTAFTSNSLSSGCGPDLSVTDSSTGASIENNIIAYSGPDGGGCPAGIPPVTGILVDSSSVTNTVSDYNDVYTFTEGPEYTWAGNPYSAAADLYSKTGQGKHDVDSYLSLQEEEGSPSIDSANSNAIGEQSTDMEDRARVSDPTVTQTGVGTYDYYDRGCFEFQDPINVTTHSLTQSATNAPVGGVITFTASAQDTWGDTGLGYQYSWGDGAYSTGSTAEHSYSAVGTYTVYVDATLPDFQGDEGPIGTMTVTVGPAGALSPALSVSPSGPLSVEASGASSTDGWPITGYSFNFGDSTPVASGASPTQGHVYAAPGTYKVTETVTDANGKQSSVTQSVTTQGSDYTPYGPARLLDTRSGTGEAHAALVPAGGIVKLQIAGNGSIPAGVTAVALNLTVTDDPGNGFITAYPDGESTPSSSNVNYSPGQTVANSVIVPVGSDGYVDLYNGGGLAKTTDLIADVTGYFTQTASSGYEPLAAARILDTRDGTGAVRAKVQPGQPLVLAVAGADGGKIPADATAVALNLTVTDSAGSGYLTVSPDGVPTPIASNVNYTPGTTRAASVIAKVGSDGKIDVYNGGTLAGSVDVVADVTGYFSADAPDAYVPVAPVRVFDSRAAGSSPVGGNSYVDLGPATYAAPDALPAGATAVVLNATVTETSSPGWLAITQETGTAPATSSLNWTAAYQTVPNLVLATPDAQGNLQYFNGGTGSRPIDLIVDAFGYFGND